MDAWSVGDTRLNAVERGSGYPLSGHMTYAEENERYLAVVRDSWAARVRGPPPNSRGSRG
jgi:hypothetical protein